MHIYANHLAVKALSHLITVLFSVVVSFSCVSLAQSINSVRRLMCHHGIFNVGFYISFIFTTYRLTVHPHLLTSEHQNYKDPSIGERRQPCCEMKCFFFCLAAPYLFVYFSCCCQQNSPKKKSLPPLKFLEGEVIWAKFDRRPWWPCEVIVDPALGNYHRVKGQPAALLSCCNEEGFRCQLFHHIACVLLCHLF